MILKHILAILALLTFLGGADTLRAGDYDVTFELGGDYLTETSDGLVMDELRIITDEDLTSITIYSSAAGRPVDFETWSEIYQGRTDSLLQHDEIEYRGGPALFSVTTPSAAYLASVSFAPGEGSGADVCTVSSSMDIYDFLQFVDSVSIAPAAT